MLTKGVAAAPPFLQSSLIETLHCKNGMELACSTDATRCLVTPVGNTFLISLCLGRCCKPAGILVREASQRSALWYSEYKLFLGQVHSMNANGQIS